MAKRMQRHSLGDPGQSPCLMKETIELAGRHRSVFAMPWKQPALGRRIAGIMTFGPDRPPGSQQAKQSLRQLDLAILLALTLNNPDDHLLAVDIADLEPGHFAGTHASAIRDAKENPGLECPGNSQKTLGLIDREYLRELLRLTQIIDLLGENEAPQRHPKQELQPGHFPLLDLGGKPSSLVDPLIAELKNAHVRTSVERVPYEFQKGGDRMLRVSRPDADG